MSAIPFKPWGPQAAPIYAGDTFRTARDLSAATRNRPPAKPTGAAFSLTRREARNQPDPPPFDEVVVSYALRRGE